MVKLRGMVLAIVGLTAAAGVASAQPSPPAGGGRPTFSPYLNLLRNGSSPTLNYYGLVRPEQQFRQQQSQIQQQLQQTNQTLQGLNNSMIAGGDPNIPITGHGAVYNNTLHYFSSYPRGGGGGFGGGGGYGARPINSAAAGGNSRGPSTAGNGIARR